MRTGVCARNARSYKSRGLVRQGERVVPQEGFRFVSAHWAEFPVTTMCRVLGLSSSGYYAWHRRGVCQRKRKDARLLARIRAHHATSKGRYGAPKIHADLAEEGWRVGSKRVARLMRQAGLVGVTRRRWVVTTRRGRSKRAAPDRVERDFTAKRPDQLWVADITYVPTWSGFLYLAVVLDVFSRRIVGWSMAGHLRAELVLDALDMAIRRRQPSRVIHHSDQGCQYTSLEFGERCRKAGVVPSMGSVGDCYDNAMAESFFATLECELLQTTRFRRRLLVPYVLGMRLVVEMAVGDVGQAMIAGNAEDGPGAFAQRAGG